jgi:hypothetical protein
MGYAHPNQVPNGNTTAIAVAGAGVVALPAVPADTESAVINNPNSAVVIAFGAVATATLGIRFPAGSNPILSSPEQVNSASIYWVGADAGACIQYMK